jgi:chromosome segregation ATPase
VADDRALELARRLEDDDERLAAVLDEVGVLEREVAALRERANALARFVASAPERLTAADDTIDEARRELERRRDQMARAEAELASAGRSRDERRLASAQRALERARDSLTAGERRLERATAARAELEGRVAEADVVVVPQLEEQSRALSERVAAVPRISATGVAPPDSGLDGIDDWASRVAAALFVVRSGLETERDHLIREANELAASVLGDSAADTSVALVRARVERALA